MTRSLRQLILGSLFMALGLVVPMLFHGLGLGPMLMPMFWPLALAGYWLSPALGAVVGLCTPALSALVTGMPPVPMALAHDGRAGRAVRPDRLGCTEKQPGLPGSSRPSASWSAWPWDWPWPPCWPPCWAGPPGSMPWPA